MGSESAPYVAGVPAVGSIYWQGQSRRPGSVAGSACPAVVLPFAPRRSYTGEESAELYLPGSPPLLRRLYATLEGAGFRLAQPGEFTRRAFLSGRLDLTQAAAVASLIHATSSSELEAARFALEGQLGPQITAVGDALHSLIALLEAGLDFSEQEVEPPSPEFIRGEIDAVRAQLAAIMRETSPAVERGRARVVLVGRANAGKSTLLNRLAGREVSIASEFPGTTRDAVRAEVPVGGGRQLELYDFPGERADAAAVEARAFEQAGLLFATADLVLHLVDLTRDPEDMLCEWVRGSGAAERWLVLTKADSTARRPELVPGQLVVSAETGVGIPELEERLAAWAFAEASDRRSRATSFTARQLEQLEQLDRGLAELSEPAVLESLTPELLVVDLRDAHRGVEEVTGRISPEATLDKIFAEFCLGK